MSLDHTSWWNVQNLISIESNRRTDSIIQILKAAMDPFRPRDITILVRDEVEFGSKTVIVEISNLPSYTLSFNLDRDDLIRLYDMDSLHWLGEAFAQQFLAHMEDVGDHIELGDN